MGDQHAKNRIDILICTYKRDDLLRNTLNGIENCDSANFVVRIIVVDNDKSQSARQVVDACASSSKFKYLYYCQPIKNISLTRNCALDACDSDYVLFIDDDECPGPNWISNLVKTASIYRSTLVFGPVISSYADGTPNWVIKGRFFENRARYATGSRVPLQEMRTGNVLIGGDWLRLNNIRFDSDLGLSGGEDYDFFSRMIHKGIQGVWCDEAPVYEYVPKNRATVKWLLRRSFRIGSVHGFLRRRSMQVGHIAYALSKSCALIILAISRTLLFCMFSKQKTVRGLQKLSLGLGMLYGVFRGPYSEYR